MKRSPWLIATLLTLLATAFVLTQAPRACANRTFRLASRRVELHGHARSLDPMESDAAARWRRCQPTHWRALMLQR